MSWVVVPSMRLIEIKDEEMELLNKLNFKSVVVGDSIIKMIKWVMYGDGG